MSASSDPPGGPPCGNPYKVLGLEFGATDAEITKAYRKLALKLHPDKQRPDAPKSEADRTAKKFHDANEARAFLLEADHAEERRKYNAALRSWAARRVEDERRERGMSDRRKRMREDLVARERRAAGRDAEGGAGSAGGGGGDDLVDRLRREGKAMRERYGDRQADEEARREARERRAKKAVVEGRQVRLKWSRKKIGTSHSEHGLAALLSTKFGAVEEVELVGAKGNAALVTFASPSSCGPCVKEYLDSDLMRAAFVGKRKEEEERRSPFASVPSAGRTENLEERRLRQAAEREQLLRKMEMEEAGVEVPDDREGSGKTSSATDRFRGTKDDTAVPVAEFPPKFPRCGNETPLQRLEKAESLILVNILPLEALRNIQVHEDG